MLVEMRNPAGANSGAPEISLAWQLDDPENTKALSDFQAFGSVAGWIVARIARQRGLSKPHARLVAGLAFPAGLEAAR